ncbi:MAG: MotA/TolQ/ExbB proton channel family protein [Isosphaeraceae bacterium]|nr:MotA/TolQ/ExbB proton channel family protein [Isosphaeraceae bacterium]
MQRPSTASRLRPPLLRLPTVAALSLLTLALAGGADARVSLDLDEALRWAEALGRRAEAWYRRTPSHERITWGGLLACAALALGTAMERSLRLRRQRVIPSAFRQKFLGRLDEGKLDRGKGLDYCELNPSPAARIALAALRRWGRPVGDLERAVTLAKGLEVDRLWRHIGTLRRVAALAPLIGLLGTLTSAGKTLAALGPSGQGHWGPALASALAPLTAGVALAILALVAYDGLSGRVEALTHDLDRVGAETVDAIALAMPVEPPRGMASRTDPAQAPRPVRIEIPDGIARQVEREREREGRVYRLADDWERPHTDE